MMVEMENGSLQQVYIKFEEQEIVDILNCAAERGINPDEMCRQAIMDSLYS